MDREIIVRGSAELRIPPDRALVHATLDADGGSRDDAYSGAARTAAAVDAVLATYADGAERVVTTALTVQPLTRWRKGELVRTGWRATRRSLLDLTSFERMGALLADLAAAGATIAGPDWRVDETNEAHDRVRALAAQDARRRAEAYADGLGVAVGDLRWVAEPGLRSSSPEVGHGALMSFASAPQGGSVDDEAIIEVAPADTTIAASVEVAFALATRS